MFVLVELKDTVRIPPSAFKYKLNDVIAEELNQKLANKVYKDEMERPTQNPEGVHVTLGFFEDIIIPPHKLQHPSRFDQMEQVWVWIYKTEDGETHDLFMDQGEEIRFRVVQEIFTETPLPTEPNAPNAPNASTLPSTSRDVDGKPETNNVAPYVLHGSIDESGLGLLSWWQNA